MNIRENIMHYALVYEGCETRMISRATADLAASCSNNKEAKNSVVANLNWLVENNYLEVVPFPEMNETQKQYYKSDGYCTIYRVVRHYSETDYLAGNAVSNTK